MAILRSERSARIVALAARTLIGRGPRSTLRLDDARASAEHAVLMWRDTQWWLRDLGSRNGTFVDGRRIDPGETCALGEGSRLAFGRAEATWTLADVAAPTAVARPLGGGRWRRAEQGLLLLPDDEQVEVSVYLGQDGDWRAETREGAAPVADGDHLTVGDETWLVLLPVQVAGTLESPDAPPILAESRLTFAVSRDEEHVAITLDGGGRALDLPARAHSYLLLTLARLRLDDIALPVAERGWVHHADFARMLAVDRLTLNTHISRARRQFVAAGVLDGVDIVERRSTTGLLRLGLPIDRITLTP